MFKWLKLNCNLLDFHAYFSKQHVNQAGEFRNTQDMGRNKLNCMYSWKYNACLDVFWCFKKKIGRSPVFIHLMSDVSKSDKTELKRPSRGI